VIEGDCRRMFALLPQADIASLLRYVRSVPKPDMHRNKRRARVVMIYSNTFSAPVIRLTQTYRGCQ
jgi:hypothetical protein